MKKFLKMLWAGLAMDGKQLCMIGKSKDYSFQYMKQKLIITIRMLLCFYLKNIIMTHETILISDSKIENCFLCLLFFQLTYNVTG